MPKMNLIYYWTNLKTEMQDPTFRKNLLALIAVKIMLLCLAAAKGVLDSYATIFLPAGIVSLLLLFGTAALRSDQKITVLVLILQEIGTFIQVFVYKGSLTKYILLQIIAFLGGVLLCAAVILLQKRVTYKQQWMLCLITVTALYLVLFLFGSNINGTRAWIYIGGMSFQITEFTKYLSICGMAAALLGEEEEKKKLFRMFAFVLLNGICLTMIKELGTLFLILLCFFLFTFLFIRQLKYFFISFFTMVGLLAAGIGGVYFLSRYDHPGKVDFVFVEMAAAVCGKLKNRITILTAPESMDPFGSVQQALTAQKAIRLGGILGSSYELQIPVQESEYVFVAMILKLGLLMAIVVLILFLLFLFAGIKNSEYHVSHKKTVWDAPGAIEEMTANGFVYTIYLQSLIAMLGTTNAFLIIGVAIPFLSAGGSSQMVAFAMVCYLIYTRRAISHAAYDKTKERREAVCRRKKVTLNE